MYGSIWKVSVNTGEAYELTHGNKLHSSPAWSPDGKWIVYTADDNWRSIQLEILNVATGATHTLTADEQVYLDPDSGQPLTGSFMDYGMPRADYLPSFRTEIAEVLSPTNPLGIKAGGEGGTTAAPAVMMSAILDALSELGVRDLPMPATPHVVWRAIQQAKAQAAARP